MMCRKKLLLISKLAIAFALVSPQMVAHADTGKGAATQQSQPAAGYPVSDGPVSVYGQTLNPQKIKFRDSNYTWKDLKILMPELLPNAHKISMPPNEVCDRLNEITDEYLAKTEESTNYLIYRTEFAVNAGVVKPPADLAVTSRLAVNSPEALQELIKLMPDLKPQIIEAKKRTLRSLAMILLHDAALANCPAHAKEKGYAPIASP